MVTIALVAAGVSGAGPLAGLAGGASDPDGAETVAVDDGPLVGDGSSSRLDEARAAALGAAPTESTTTTPLLERRTYAIGDCVWWGDTGGSVDRLDTKVVPCEEPHVMEVTGRYRVEDGTGAYPREAYWDALFDSGPCLALAERYLGVKLDPNGNYYANGVMPSVGSWRDGDREVWCGIGVVPYEAARAALEDGESTGPVKASEQYRVFPVGSCLGEAGTADDTAWGVVPCDAPHNSEVAGHVDVTDRLRELPADDGWGPVVADDCERLAKAYAGAALRDPVRVGWLAIEAGSWDAGRRTLLCTVSEYRNDRPATITRRIGP